MVTKRPATLSNEPKGCYIKSHIRSYERDDEKNERDDCQICTILR